jgi:hypothetical protein
MNLPGESRRAFLRKTAAATAGATAASLLPGLSLEKSAVIPIISDPADPVAQEPPVRWALEHLRAALAARGFEAPVLLAGQDLPPGTLSILAATGKSPLAQQVLKTARVVMPDVPEAIGLVRATLPLPQAGARAKPRVGPALLACGGDVRGLVYALLELADRAQFAADPLADLKAIERIIQKPANAVRSVARLFSSEVEDKSWFNDRAFWQRYLTELATQRFNRFSLTLGLGYDFPTDIRDAYFHFAYPFLLTVPGCPARAVPLPDSERDHNLDVLRFISEETVRRGLNFQLGLWTHAYKWVDSPKANYVIEGLTPETHPGYCRDALEALLKACPAISGVTFRIHGESGIAEGSYDFWKAIFEGVVRCGRKVEIDMHAKGMDDAMIELALGTGMPITISPKFWAEHMGLGYMQGAIRPQEMPPKEERNTGFFSRSSGSRRFLRYGYGDLLRKDRRYQVVHRIWPGTQRLLVWGDPALAADYGRAASFCGSAGLEWCEPLSFKGRKGSGLPGGREAYADPSLRPADGDFKKYLYTYRLWGRHLYDPDCNADQWRRFLNHQFGRAAPSLETALSEASRILPLITTAHCPAAANNNYWPEMYTHMPIVDAKRPHPYGESLNPKRFGAVSSLDPEFFSRVVDFAASLLSGGPDGKYSPAWVAATLEAAAENAESRLRRAGGKIRDRANPEFRRMAADIEIQAGLGQFFAWKFRSAALFELYESTRDRQPLEAGLDACRRARAAWAKMAERARAVYVGDVTFGPGAFQRGHWLDRLPAIDADLADLEKLLQSEKNSPAPPSKVVMKAIAAILQQKPELSTPSLEQFHTPPKSFRRGASLLIEASLPANKPGLRLSSLHLRYRHVNQAEVWQAIAMERNGRGFHASIPAEYTDSPFPLQYHFQARESSGNAWLFPGLKTGWQGQPYYVVMSGRMPS